MSSYICDLILKLMFRKLGDVLRWLFGKVQKDHVTGVNPHILELDDEPCTRTELYDCTQLGYIGVCMSICEASSFQQPW